MHRSTWKQPLLSGAIQPSWSIYSFAIQIQSYQFLIRYALRIFKLVTLPFGAIDQPNVGRCQCQFCSLLQSVNDSVPLAQLLI